jgi:predicted transcriptional regulator
VGSTPDISQKDVAKRLDMDREAVGYHLRELSREGTLKAEKNGRFTIYRKGKGKADGRHDGDGRPEDDGKDVGRGDGQGQ